MDKIKLSILIMLAILPLQIKVCAQSTSIIGRVYLNDTVNNMLVYISLSRIVDARTVLVKNFQCDENGQFTIEKIEAGDYLVSVSCLGYSSIVKRIRLNKGDIARINVRIEQKDIELSGVEVVAKSQTLQRRESPQPVSIVDTRSLYAQSAGSSAIINKVSGVKVRENGGMGSNADISINGISGRQVRFFIDAIPTDYLGAGLNINVLPVDLIERIEVYKGVVPVELGADALGGAINIVTRSTNENYLDLSYSSGSFGSRKLNLNTRHRSNRSGLFVSVNGFYNRSDNNYFVNVEIPDSIGTPHNARVRRFHDFYRNYLGSVETGFSNKRWADILSLKFSVSGFYDEIQHNAIMYQPFGQVFTKGTNYYSALKYQKKELFKNFDISVYAAFSQISSLFADTSYSVYTWDGKVVDRRFVGGEISSSRNLLHFNTENGIGRVSVNYRITKNSYLSANIVTTYFERKGFDNVAEEYYGTDFFKLPVSMTKNVSGIAFNASFLDGRIASITSIKHFYYRAKGFEINSFREQVDTTQVETRMGFNQSLKYQINRKLLVRTSYEYSTRLPDEYEIFGDFILVNPNPNIEPEISHNVNLGTLYSDEKVTFDVNCFLRSTSNIIYLKTSRFYSQYLNLLKAHITGIEGEITYKPAKMFFLSINATYQDIRNRSPKGNSGVVDDRYFNARMPNIPYFFGNAEIRFLRNIKKDDALQIWWNGGYVHEFYLYWAIDGIDDSKAVIPGQFIQNAGVSYTFSRHRLSISLESFNLTDAKAYDNYSVQKPGRSFSCKFRYFISKK